MKKITAFLLAVLMLLSFSACGADETAAASAADNAPAAVSSESGFVPALDTGTEAMLYFVGSWGNFEALDQVAVDFQVYYPNVQIVYTKLDDYGSDLANRFATGEEVDLFTSSWWDGEYQQNQNIADHAEDLNTAGLDLSVINPDMLSGGEVNGKQVLIPLYLQAFGYMVNLDIFKAAGVAVPTNYRELLDACEKLSAAGYEHPIYVNSSFYGRSFSGFYMKQLLAGDDAAAALDTTIARIDELYSSGYVTDEGDTLEDSYNAMILRFFEGDVPLQSISTSNFSGTKKREAKSEAFTAAPFEYAFIPAPYGDDSDYAYINQLGSLYVGVYKDSPNRDLANEFLRFLLTDEEMYRMQSIKNMPTAFLSNGMDTFPYLKSADVFYAAEPGISALLEEYGLNTLSRYTSSGSHDEMIDLMRSYMENGLN